MITSCPKCQTRYRVAPEKIGPEGARLRCTRCENVFRVERPDVDGSESSAGRISALVVECDPETAKGIVGLLDRWGISAEVAQEGGEGLLKLFRRRPQLAILGGHLPGVTAPVISEIVRRAAELKDMRLIRVAPFDEPAGAPEFDAEHTIEPGQLPDGVGDLLEKLGLGQRPAAPPPPEPKPEPQISEPPKPPVEQPQAMPEAKAQPTPRSKRSESSDPEIAAAERLARIIASDIILYNEEKFAMAARAGNVVDSLKDELPEAEALFRRRIPEEIRAKRNFIADELEARAATLREKS